MMTNELIYELVDSRSVAYSWPKYTSANFHGSFMWVVVEEDEVVEGRLGLLNILDWVNGELA